MYAVDDMTIFVRVVERASLSAAGRELRLSPAVVSSRITKLEARLGVRQLAHSPRDLAIHVLAPPHRMRPPKSRAFINFIAERLSKLPPARMAKAFEAETG